MLFLKKYTMLCVEKGLNITMLKVYKEEKERKYLQFVLLIVVRYFSLMKSIKLCTHGSMYMDVHSTVHNLIYTHFLNKHTHTHSVYIHIWYTSPFCVFTWTNFQMPKYRYILYSTVKVSPLLKILYFLNIWFLWWQERKKK